MSEIDEVVSEFLVESHESLEEYDQDLLTLEQDPGAREPLGRIFRNVHTIKGTCGFLGFGSLEALAHAGETLLGRLRDGEIAVDSDIVSALLAMGDAMRETLAAIEATGAEGEADHGELVGVLTSLGERADASDEAAESASDAEGADGGGADGEGADGEGADGEGGTAGGPGGADDVGDRDDQEASEDARRLGDILVDGGAATEEQVSLAAHEQELGDARPIGEILVEHGGTSEEDVSAALSAQGGARGSVADSSVRVDVGLLDHLMNLMGELVLARNQVVRLAGDGGDGDLTGASQRLNLITSELQEGVMKTRMQPISNMWGRLPRVVRDLAKQCGKRVRVEMEGQDTELDKSLLEAIKDPLTHLVRNAVDHGIEDPAAREGAGKAAEGVLRLRAFHEGGQVNIEISDDGAGIDPARIASVAVERGVISAEEAARLSDREAVDLIFAPGFSTATEITSVSGRGVGMDVVKSDIERSGGTVDVASVVGGGTTFKVKIPLTLAIIPALIVSTGGDRFAIPQIALTELVRLQGEAARNGIEHIHGAPVHRLRGRLLPLVFLSEQLGDGAPGEAEVRNIVVLHADGQQFGLVVDEIHDTEEIVVKPLGKQVKDVPVFAGATIMGDGRVALILDVLGIAQRARVLGETAERQATEEPAEADAGAEEEGERLTLLLVDVGAGRRAAIPLSEVARLEEFPADAVEWTGQQEVVQYRGDILPLVRLADALGHGAGAEAGDEIQVVVHASGDRHIGLVVGGVVDIVDSAVTAVEDGGPGMVGRSIAHGRVTDVVDIAELIGRAAGALRVGV